MLTCQQLTELISDYLAGRLSIGQRMRFQLHLGICRHCRRYLRQMKATLGALGKLTPESVPPRVMAELMSRFKQWNSA